MADRNDSSDEERQVRIKNLINEIKNSKGKGRRGKTKTSSNMTTEQDPGPVSGRVRTRGGRHKEHKVHFNWIHHTEHKNGRISYKQVRAKQGGGPREISYPIDQIQTVESLLNLGKSLYFPGGKSPLGSIDNMEFALSTLDGTPLEFQDRDHNMCSYQEYLKSLGTFSSNHYLYIRTKFVGSLVINDNVPETLNIKYCRYQPSFDGTMSYISARSIEACMSVHNEQIHDPNDVLESFIPESIQVGRKLYLDKNGENYVYPQSTNDAIIVHGPGTVCGTEDCGKSLILGVITTSHGKGDYVITWTLNNECISSGPNRYLIHITQPGEYNAQVQINGTTYTFKPAITVGSSNKSYSDLVENRELSAKSIEKSERIQEESAERSPNRANNTIEHIQEESAERSPNRANNTIEHIQEASAERSPNRANNTIEHIQEESAERSPNRANNTIEHIQEESAERSPNRANNTIEHIQEASAERSPNRANNTIEHIQEESAERSPNRANNTIEHIQEESAEQSPNRDNTDEPLRKKCKLQFPEESSVSPLNIQFDHFDLFDKIGEGGFGEVYKGRYLGTNAAVKKIKIKRMKLVKRSVLREVEVNSHIRHPNIVLLMGYSLQADHLYMITEMIQGPNLDDVLFGEQEITLNIDQKHNISKQVAQGISYLHNRSPEIIHRDIKPENILLSMSCETAKICDMGLSKLQNINTMQSTMINRNQMQPGTPAYQAPEVCVQLKSATKPADIWSLACTYTELYTEETIWDIEENDECSIDQIIKFMRNKEKPHRLYRLGGLMDIPCSIRKVITDGFSYNPDARPNALNICILFSEITK